MIFRLINLTMCWFMVKKLGMIIWQPLVCLQDLFGLVWTCLLAGHIKTGSGFTQGGYCRSMTVHRFFFYFQLQNKRSKRVSWFEHCSLSGVIWWKYQLVTHWKRQGPSSVLVRTIHIHHHVILTEKHLLELKVSQCTRHWAIGAAWEVEKGSELWESEGLVRWG